MEMDLDTSADDKEQIIPRPYQADLEEIAINKNTIIHLPTGSGKTFIAARLITRFRAALQKPWGQGGKRTFFLVNTVPLVFQQKKVIELLCPVQGVACYSGEDGVDYWDKNKWNDELAKYQVIVMTCQILSDMLTHNYIKIKDINLLIFDECHHAVIDHPMRLVMKHFEGCHPSKQPRVLGLTATLLNGNVKISKLEETLEDLETTFHATIATVNEMGEILKYSTNPVEIVEYYDSPIPTSASENAIDVLDELMANVISVKLPKVERNKEFLLKEEQRDITSDPNKIVKSVKNMISSIVMSIRELGVYGGNVAIIAYTILLERLKRKSFSKQEEQLYRFTITHCTYAKMILLNSMKNDDGYEKIVKHSSGKVVKLLHVLKEYNPSVIESNKTMNVNKSRKPLSGIIFTQQRFTSKILYNILKDVIQLNPQEFGFLKHDFIVGFNINPMKNVREQYYTKKSSQTVLLKFSNKDLNCLISTSVIEEGVDIPQCTLVVRFDEPLEYRSYIQSKGRARSTEASFVILINNAEKSKFLSKYRHFQDTENSIRRILMRTVIDREKPSQSQIQRELYEEDDIPPYITENGNRLSSVQAISLLNRYCSVLPHDQFTLITPMWLQETVENDKVMITIVMPKGCPVKKPIQGMPYINKKTAKRSAALSACIELHKVGELDAVTLLPRCYSKVDFDLPDVRECFPNWPWDENEDNPNVPKAGTKKCVRKHEKVFPVFLDGPSDWKFGTETFYLHIIKLQTAFDSPEDSRNRALYDLLQKEEGFGFLTQQALPTLCDFPMFLSVGEVKTSIIMNYAVTKLDLKLFELIKKFHYFVFDQVLEVAKKFNVFYGTKNCLYVVPVKNDDGYNIDWNVIQTHTVIRPVVEPTLEERKSISVTEKSYRYHVVSPWYRSNINRDRYVVSNVLEYLTPKSQFDVDSYGSYIDYYRSKYNVDIVGNSDQPLLEVCNINTRMNCLLPRSATLKQLSDKQKKLITMAQGDDKIKVFNEIFIPEFCIKYEFPAVLWYKATMLPSIVHRIHMLLIAYELRLEITKATKYGDTILPKGQEWLPIEVNIHKVVKSMLSMIEEPTTSNTIDRINNPIDENAPRPKTIMAMRESLYELMKLKISKDYPWDEKLEPLDIERNVSSTTLLDIELYDEFVSAPISTTTDPLVGKSPPRLPNIAPAILPPPLKYNEKIDLLSKTPSGRGPELRDLLAALTTINSHDCFDLERTETLGDSCLKFLASLYLHHKFDTLNEGQLTNIKSRLIGNRNLYYAGEKIRLGGRMKVEQFSPKKDFLIPGFFAPQQVKELIEEKQIRPTFLIGIQFSESEALSGHITKESWDLVLERYTDCEGITENESIGHSQNSMQCYVRAQAVSDKSIADCIEALIGTYLLSGGILGAVKVLEWLNIIPSKDNVGELIYKNVPTVLKEGKATEEEIEFLILNCRSDVENILNYKFKDPSFMLEALSHPSYIRNRYTRSYERLEFLGDAILDFLITSYIFENCRDLKPGEMTDLRSALVNNVTFASYVVKLGLQKFLCSEISPALDKAIMFFVEHQQQRDHKIVEDVLYLIDEEDCHIAEYVEVPKVLSDIFESLVGAIFLDSGGDLQTVWSVVYRIMHVEIEMFSINIPQQPVRMLYEMIHACPDFGPSQVTDTEVPRVMVPVTITNKLGIRQRVCGFGANKFQAKRAASKLALRILGI